MPTKSKVTPNHSNHDKVGEEKSESNAIKLFGSPVETSSPVSTSKSEDQSRRQSSSPNRSSSDSLPTSRAPSVNSDNKPEVVITSESMIKLLIPVSICMLLSVLMVKFVCKKMCWKGMAVTYITPIKEDINSSNADKAIASIINALVYVSVLCVVTFLMVLMFILRCYKVIIGYLIFVTSLLLIAVTGVTLKDIFEEHNIAIDNITVYLFLWNHAVLGILSIFWRGPLIVQQSYLILNSVLVSIKMMSFLLEWTTWTLLIVLAIWDLTAVLCPLGPLKLLMDTMKRRKEKGEKVNLPPGLIYSTMVWTLITDVVISVVKKHETDNKTTEERLKKKSEEKETYSPKLGLGDFVFYSILVGKASVYDDWNITIGCYVGILVGLGLTLLLLAIFKRALPALPISILFGVSIFLITKFSFTPFLDALQTKLIHI